METRAILALSITSAFALAVALLTLSEWYDRRRGINDGVGASPHGRFRLALICAAIAAVGVLYPDKARAMALPIGGLILAAFVLWICAKTFLVRRRWGRVQQLLARFNQGDVTGSLRDARQRCEQHPSDILAWVALAALLFQDQQWEAAEQAANHYQRLRPNGNDLVGLAPMAVKKQGRLTDADTMYNTDIKRHPNNINLLLDHCRLLIELGRFDEADERYQASRQMREQSNGLTKAYLELLDQQLEECRALLAAPSQQHDPKS